MKRWLAKISYRTEIGTKLVNHEFEELYELHDLVEKGPDWDAIASIEVSKFRPGPLGPLTLERAQSVRGYNLLNLD